MTVTGRERILSSIRSVMTNYEARRLVADGWNVYQEANLDTITIRFEILGTARFGERMQQGLTVSIPGLEYGATFESEYELRGMLDLIERDIDEAIEQTTGVNVAQQGQWNNGRGNNNLAAQAREREEQRRQDRARTMDAARYNGFTPATVSPSIQTRSNNNTIENWLYGTNSTATDSWLIEYRNRSPTNSVFADLTDTEIAATRVANTGFIARETPVRELRPSLQETTVTGGPRMLGGNLNLGMVRGNTLNTWEMQGEGWNRPIVGNEATPLGGIGHTINIGSGGGGGFGPPLGIGVQTAGTAGPNWYDQNAQTLLMPGATPAFTKEMLFEMLRDCLNMKVSVSNSGGDIDVSVELFLVEEDGTQTLVASDQDFITLD
jgi:hypothetical protein